MYARHVYVRRRNTQETLASVHKAYRSRCENLSSLPQRGIVPPVGGGHLFGVFLDGREVSGVDESLHDRLLSRRERQKRPPVNSSIYKDGVLPQRVHWRAPKNVLPGTGAAEVDANSAGSGWLYATTPGNYGTMDFPLNLPPGERQQEFIDQISAALRRISSGAEGSSGFLPDGSFEASTASEYRLQSDLQLRLTWTIRKTPDGTLSNIGVEGSQPNAPAGWELAAQHLIASALAATVAGSRQRFFQRISFAYIGPALDGEYWLPGFRLGPAIPNDEHPASPMVERWVDIDMNVDAIDATHAGALAGERARRIAARLSLLLDLGFEWPRHEFRWAVVRRSDGKSENQRCQIMFQRTDHQPVAMPEKGALCSLGAYTDGFPSYMMATGRVRLPQDIRRVLRGADARPHPIADALDGCARLYQVGRVGGRQFPSVLLAYTIAAAEAITQADRSYDGFKGFMRTHLKGAPTDPFLNYLYGNVRSAHFHAGHFPLGEFGPGYSNILMDPEWVRASRLRWDGVTAVRDAIIDWCLRKVAVEADV
jgi:hypothetical protein